MGYWTGFDAAITSIFGIGISSLLLFSFLAGYHNVLLQAVMSAALFLACLVLMIWRHQRWMRLPASESRLITEQSTFAQGWENGIRCMRGF